MRSNLKQESLAAMLRKMRKGNSALTLDYLARETGLMPEYIANVEKGKIAPPVSNILKLSHALQMDPGTLLDETRKDSCEGGRKRVRRRVEGYSYELLSPSSLKRQMRVFRVYVDPRNEGEKLTIHQHDGEEFQYVLRGNVEITVGENKYILGPGESLHFNSSLRHTLRALTTEPAELLIVVTCFPFFPE